AHDHFVHLVGGEAGVLERAADGGAAQRRSRDAGELAEEGTDGGALGAYDDDVTHGGLHLELGRASRPWVGSTGAGQDLSLNSSRPISMRRISLVPAPMA